MKLIEALRFLFLVILQDSHTNITFSVKIFLTPGGTGVVFGYYDPFAF